jgi:hypothetical protein
VHCENSNFLVLYIHEEKLPPNFSANPTLELLFAKNACANRSKNASSLADRASNNKIKIVAHPTNHGKAHFGSTQQPTNNTSLSLEVIASSLCNYISEDCCIVASFLDLVKIPHHGHVGHGNYDFETVLQAIQLILVE